MQDRTPPHTSRAIKLVIVVAALGYFVDIYDLLLFSIIRVPSLRNMGVPDSELLSVGASLIQLQMGGMLLGGILWGILGDKKGRLSVLFGSIIIYSIANILNGFVHSVEAYGIMRVIAGIGLAGELGAGITIVSEMMPKNKRGYGTMIVASVGILGAVFAALLSDIIKDWRTLYFIGGGMGIALLLLRIGIYESGMYESIRKQNVRRGNFLSLFSHRKQFLKYLSVVMIGLPTWFVVGILITFADEFGKAMGMVNIPVPGKAVMFCYIGISLGDIGCGGISQLLKSRKKAMFLFLLITSFAMALYFTIAAGSIESFYFVCALLGFGAGFWAIFVTIASEQFGTNIRATVTTTVPNFVRGALVPITALFRGLQGSTGTTSSAIIVGSLTLAIALIALSRLEETFHKDLDYIEPLS
ncbi:MAG: MFS transporter [Ignavibacteriota bacterium]